ncbi:MAG: hypothetical protein RIR02_1460, partial [Pseudomonadota bacterium]
MSFKDAIETILPSQDNISAHITGNFGEIRKEASDGRIPGPHGGVDFRYENKSIDINS